MPRSKKKGRGKTIKTRTKSLPGGKYIRVDVMEKPGPRGGKTVAGPVRTKKEPTKRKRSRGRKC